MQLRLSLLGPTVVALACSTPPSGLVDGSTSDAAASDAAEIDATIDASVTDASPADAEPADAPVADASGPDALPQVNPLGITFVDVTSSVGDIPGGAQTMDPYGIGTGVAIGDLDNDGKLDLVLPRCDEAQPAGPTLLLMQTGTTAEFPVFTSDTTFSQMFTGACAHGAALGDYDADGDLDLFVSMRGPDRLLENDGTGQFTDVTTAAGVAGPAGGNSTGGVWADVNNDGLLDLYVLAHTTVLPPKPDALQANRLFINLGDKTFREVGAVSGSAGNGSSQAALFADLDNDGDLEVYVANDRFSINGVGGTDEIDGDVWLDPTSFDDEGIPTYTDRAAQFGITGKRSAMGIALADLNGDGVDDIYVSDWGPNHLQIWNSGTAMYDLHASLWGLARKENPDKYFYVTWGVRFVDFDRDGREELFVINGSTELSASCANQTQLNLFLRRFDTADYFVDISDLVGWPADYDCPVVGDIPISSRAAAIGDLDGDGDDDVIVTPFAEKVRFYRNDTPQASRHRVRVRPIGTVSAPDPVGAVLEVQLSGGGTIRRTLYAGGDTYSQSDRVLEAGIGSDTTVASATLRWPSGYTQRLDLTSGFAIDTELTITEPAWLTLSDRVVSSSDPTPTITLTPVDAAGDPLGTGGLIVTGTRSDGVAVSFTDMGDGTYVASLVHPGSVRITVVTVVASGMTLQIRPTINYQ